jgi:Glycosyl hydrolase family 20, catalytic domain
MNRQGYDGVVLRSMAHQPEIISARNQPPTALVRGFLLDSARCLEKQSYYRKAIDFAADRGMNTLLWHFTDDQGCSLNFESVPGIGSPNAFTKAEMSRLIEYAADRGIDIVPELASLGHSRYITRLPGYRDLSENETIFSGMSPVAARTRKVLKWLIEETAEVFPSKRFHVGLDEANFGDHHLTREALQSRKHFEIFADHVNFLHGLLKSCGRQMWMWADGVLNEREIARLIPRDIVMCDWQYRPQVPPDSTQYLLNEGFDVLLVSALISHDQPLFPGYEFALPNIPALRKHESLRGKGRILGSLTTIWTPVRFLADSLWLGVHLAAEIQRDGPESDLRQSIARFGTEFYGIRDSADWAQSCDRLLRLMPLRSEWLAVAKLDATYPFADSDIARKAMQLSEIARNLKSYVREVRKNQREYRTFLLMVEVLAHAYDAANQIASAGSLTALALETLKSRRERLLHRVEANWDRERHADDPAKYKPVVEFFRDDHLILILQKGLESLGAMKNRFERERARPSPVAAS